MFDNRKSEDTIKALGLLALGSRLKRLGERLQAETETLLGELKPVVPASQHPLLAAIDRRGPLTVGELADALGVTQPGVTRTVGQLSESGLVEVRSAPEDGRRRLVALTPSGQRFVAAAKRKAWPRVETAVTDLCSGFADELLRHLESIEEGLVRKGLRARVDEGDRR